MPHDVNPMFHTFQERAESLQQFLRQIPQSSRRFKEKLERPDFGATITASHSVARIDCPLYSQ